MDHETWLDLSEAASYLGVHFTTLRRWADAGEVAFIRTPGGRRRFSLTVLMQFVQAMAQASTADLALVSSARSPLNDLAIDHARQSVRNLPPGESWLGRMNDDQRQQMKGSGRRLMALLLQYSGRSEGGEAFVEEGRRITREYSQVCSFIGLTLEETVHIFLFFRRSILDAIHETGYLDSSKDSESLRLYQRTTDFLDTLLLHLINSYMQSRVQIPG